MRKVAGAAVVLGLALSACSTDGGGPQFGGIAAEVDGETITLDDVETLTAAWCVTQEAQGFSNMRSEISGGLAGRLVQVAIVDELGMAQDASSEITSAEVPGWAEMTADERDALMSYLDGQARLGQALQDLGPERASSSEEAQQAAFDALAERVVEEDVDISINPRYEIRVDEGRIVGAESLSVPVGDEARGPKDADVDYLSSLPEAQLCGVRPGEGVQG